MSCPDLDLVLDAGFDVPADVRNHLATCPACAAEMQTAAAFAAGFAEMRTETAPAAVVAAALAAARHPAEPRRTAPDRAARPGRSARPVRWLVAATVLGAVLLAVGLQQRTGSDRTVPVVADATVPAPSRAAPSVAAPTPPESDVAAATIPTPDVPDQAPAPPPASLPRAEPVPMVPAPAAPAQTARPALRTVPDAAPREELASSAVPDSVAAAVDGALLAFNLVADAQRVASRTITHEAERLGTTLSDAVGTPNLP